MEENNWNLSRFCNKIDTSVIGGASKLLNHFIKVYKPLRIISYADKSWSNGDLYNTLGFSIISETDPDYKYIVGNERKHKRNFSVNESEITKYYNKIWDCGKIKVELKP